MEFIETSLFTRQITEILSHDEYIEFQLELLADPKKGAVIPRGGGLRKVRVGLEGRGKRGGARVIYYFISRSQELYLLLAYPKNVQDNLSEEQLKVLRQLVKELDNG